MSNTMACFPTLAGPWNICRTRVACFLAMLLVLSSTFFYAQQNPKRLVLKDGSYQTATRWEISGNRVRYYSAERYAWEELPKDMVDWPATEKYNRERDATRSTSVAQIAKDNHKDDKDDKDDDDVAGPEPALVAPGLRLPDGGGVFVLDMYQNQPQLVELGQNGGELNRHTGRNILRAATNPLALSSRQTIELQGERAKVQAHVTQPAIYVNVDSDGSNPAASPAPPAKNGAPAAERYGIVRLEKRKGVRVVGNLNVAIYGKVSQKENWIKTTSEPAGEWMKVSPVEPLAPGEYAVVEMLERGQINLYVWDFGIDPSAPANANAWTPRHSAPGPDDKPPELRKRPK